MDRFLLGLIGLVLLAALPARAQPSSSFDVPGKAFLAAPLKGEPPVEMELADLRPVESTDRWWAPDKIQHVTFSFLLTLSTQYALENKAGWSQGDALPVSAGTTALVGLAKETYDWRLGSTHRFSLRDLVADAAGILLAIGAILL